jgi:hypothetical protein
MSLGFVGNRGFSTGAMVFQMCCWVLRFQRDSPQIQMCQPFCTQFRPAGESTIETTHKLGVKTREALCNFSQTRIIALAIHALPSRLNTCPPSSSTLLFSSNTTLPAQQLHRGSTDHNVASRPSALRSQINSHLDFKLDSQVREYHCLQRLHSSDLHRAFFRRCCRRSALPAAKPALQARSKLP